MLQRESLNMRVVLAAAAVFIPPGVIRLNGHYPLSPLEHQISWSCERRLTTHIHVKVLLLNHHPSLMSLFLLNLGFLSLPSYIIKLINPLPGFISFCKVFECLCIRSWKSENL